MIWIRILLFDLIWMASYRFIEVMYLKRYVKFSFPINFVVLIRVAYGSGSGSSTPRARDGSGILL
jgi:hypothetical protein